MLDVKEGLNAGFCSLFPVQAGGAFQQPQGWLSNAFVFMAWKAPDPGLCRDDEQNQGFLKRWRSRGWFGVGLNVGLGVILGERLDHVKA